MSDVLARDAESHVVLGRRDRGGAGAGEHDAESSAMFLPTHSSALSSAAPEMIAVPCWSSWKTGIFSVFRSVSSM